MKLRPEFELLDNCFKLLLKGEDINKEFLERTRDHIRVCEHIVKPDADIENSIIHRTTYWWRKRAAPFGMDMSAKTIPNAPTSSTPPEPLKYTAEDARILRSIKIGVKDEDMLKEKDEGDLSPLV